MAVLYLLMASPMLRAYMESFMVGHMLVQMPLLVTIGFFAAALLPMHLRGWLQQFNGGGVPFALLAVFASAFWMLPRSLDGALTLWEMEAAKFITLPLLIGMPLALSWQRLSTPARGFIWSNLLSMLIVLGWLYTVAPIRICNSYLVGQQQLLGKSLLLLAAALAVLLVSSLFCGAGDRVRHYATGME